jgi:hypothetical protein
MELLKFEWIGIIFFFIVLVSIQYTLNKTLFILKEIKSELYRRK